jgi:hypothetical protein
MKNKNRIINKIEKIRSQNNKNWMNLMKLAFKYAPKESSKILKNINKLDNKISLEVKKLSE